MTNKIESTKLKVGDSTNCFLGSVIHIPIEPHFAGDYRLEYGYQFSFPTIFVETSF